MSMKAKLNWIKSNHNKPNRILLNQIYLFKTNQIKLNLKKTHKKRFPVNFVLNFLTEKSFLVKTLSCKIDLIGLIPKFQKFDHLKSFNIWQLCKLRLLLILILFIWIFVQFPFPFSLLALTIFLASRSTISSNPIA